MFPSKHLSKQYLFNIWPLPFMGWTLGFCGLWPFWALSFAKINKKNFKCEGE